ncbi:hypothetical protein GQR36_26600 [Enterococcus termitis]
MKRGIIIGLFLVSLTVSWYAYHMELSNISANENNSTFASTEVKTKVIGGKLTPALNPEPRTYHSGSSSKTKSQPQ